MTADAAARAATTSAPDGPLRCAVVVNPARVEDLEQRRAAVDAALTDAGWPAPEWIETTPDSPGVEQARQAAADGFDVVFACGGDGTVRSCVEGLVGTSTALAILPAGTGNLLATNLGVPQDPTAGVGLVLERGRRRIDVGVVAGDDDDDRDQQDDDGERGSGQAFAVMAGMGFDAAMLDDADSRLKSRFGPVAYVVSAVKHLGDRSMHLEITLDDHPPLRRRARSVVVGNVGRLQAGVRLLEHASPDDGVVDVAVLAPRNLAHWVRLAWGVVRRHSRVPHLEVHRASRVVVRADREHPRELDGDVIDPGRSLVVNVRERSLEPCVPQPERSADLAEGSERL
ncbi:Diacylglycerol kinase family enzyme [Quadrisphaera granulorum]|uniref:Diacylglycerol kinase family enzyme n=1 Tax=Quadrisphaera granulorum TaxID=317664 RepID=A0A316A6Q6_9ACTN|nr:diacylglycerol kinase family protein [Quadrisphaera granulorum]PWJ53616.1 diacylglycerol kinase family enzyme [Quadrisphaera granulorum]SZE96660.1 Diacylglycerol kinase family enzyme [Quadrisphaera granulorum]